MLRRFMTKPDALPAKTSPHDDHPASVGRIGVLLVNLGTPDATDYWSMRRYLKEFLSDRRVVEQKRLTWWPILNPVILSILPTRKSRDHARILNPERDEAPLTSLTPAPAEKLSP